MKILFNMLCVKYFGVSYRTIRALLKYSFDPIHTYQYEYLTEQEKKILSSMDYCELKSKLK